MESELKDLNPNSNSNQQQSLDPIDEASSKDDRPLLKPDDSAPLSPPPISAANIEELEKKFTAFVRNDVYGTMGRGELPWTEKVLLGIAFLTLVPIRVVLAMTILVFYYLICRICTLFSSPNREEEQEDYAHLGGWRRAVIVRSGRFLSRVMLFVLGFYWIKETNRSSDIDGKLNTEVLISELISLFFGFLILGFWFKTYSTITVNVIFVGVHTISPIHKMYLSPSFIPLHTKSHWSFSDLSVFEARMVNKDIKFDDDDSTCF